MQRIPTFVHRRRSNAWSPAARARRSGPRGVPGIAVFTCRVRRISLPEEFESKTPSFALKPFLVARDNAAHRRTDGVRSCFADIRSRRIFASFLQWPTYSDRLHTTVQNLCTAARTPAFRRPSLYLPCADKHSSPARRGTVGRWTLGAYASTRIEPTAASVHPKLAELRCASQYEVLKPHPIHVSTAFRIVTIRHTILAAPCTKHLVLTGATGITPSEYIQHRRTKVGPSCREEYHT
ncbi:hypothetical protein JB92DRAFT_2882935 [Gautieria morchelliformis]|nr:hypothetical protein JB92DRAFT_2882935 [Gautieria morchelliformis]